MSKRFHYNRDSDELGNNESNKRSRLRDKPFMNNNWKLKIDPQPPEYAFCGVYFPMEIFLVGQDDVKHTGYELPLDIQLMINDENVSNQTGHINTKLMEIDPNTPPIISHNGAALVNVRINELSMNRLNHKFSFVVKPQRGAKEKINLPSEVNSMVSNYFSVINYQLSIVYTYGWESVWFKDQGGRDKCIEFDVRVLGPDGIMTGMRIPLRCVLLYDDGELVPNQELLIHGADSSTEIDPETGFATIRVRIDDVSKNHQSRRFKIRVEPDISNTPAHGDKSPDVTKTITVRSKLNKRQKEKLKLVQKQNDGLEFRGVNNNISRGPEVPSVVDHSPQLQQQVATNFDHDVLQWCGNAHKALLDMRGQIDILLNGYSKIIESVQVGSSQDLLRGLTESMNIFNPENSEIPRGISLLLGFPDISRSHSLAP